MAEERLLKIQSKKASGNASKGARSYSLSLPTAWVKQLGMDKEYSRTLKVVFDGKSIVLTKRPEMTSSELKEYIQKNYKKNEPILLEDIAVSAKQPTSIIQNLLEALEKENFIKKDDDYYIYYIPQKTFLLKKDSKPSSYKIAIAKFIGRGENIQGFISGMSLASTLGLTTQISNTIEIVSNRMISDREKKLFPNVVVKPSPIPINKKNQEILQFLTAVEDSEIYSELPKDETVKKLKKYAEAIQFQRSKSRTLAKNFPQAFTLIRTEKL